MGRPKKDEDSKMDAMVVFRMTQKEKEELTDFMKDAGFVSLSDFIRECVLGAVRKG